MSSGIEKISPNLNATYRSSLLCQILCFKISCILVQEQLAKAISQKLPVPEILPGEQMKQYPIDPHHFDNIHPCKAFHPRYQRPREPAPTIMVKYSILDQSNLAI